MFMLFIGFMLCISIWEISVRENRPLPESYYKAFSSDDPSDVTVTAHSTPNTAAYHIRKQHSWLPKDQQWQYHNITPNNDKTNLIDLNDFDFLINQPDCSANVTNNNHNSNNHTTAAQPINAQRPIVLILVHSAPKNVNKRNVIRQTWGQYDPRARLYFLLGAVKSTAAQAKLRQENLQYNDIIQGNFIDSYRNMTYKHIMALKWFVYNCRHVNYLLKTDDDVFVNTPLLYDFLNGRTTDDHSYLFCRKVEGSRIKRTYRSKWRVSTKEYTGWYYPPYCPGYSIIYSHDVVNQLYREAQQTPYFWIDDVHVTGTLAHNLNMTITSVGKYYMDWKQRDNVLNGNLDFTQPKPIFLFTAPNLLEKQIRSLWQVTINSPLPGKSLE